MRRWEEFSEWEQYVIKLLAKDTCVEDMNINIYKEQESVKFYNVCDSFEEMYIEDGLGTKERI